MSTIYHASGSFHYPSSQALQQVITQLLKTPVLKQCASPYGGNEPPTLLIFQDGDPEVHMEHPANFEQNTFTLPYGDYRDAPSLLQMLSTGATHYQAEYLSEETPVVAFINEQGVRMATGLQAFESLLGTLSADEKLAFTPEQWDAAGIELDEPEQYDDERRFQLTDGVLQRVLRALIEKQNEPE